MRHDAEIKKKKKSRVRWKKQPERAKELKFSSFRSKSAWYFEVTAISGRIVDLLQ